MADSSTQNDFYKRSVVAQFHLAPKLFGEKVEYPFYDAEVNELRMQTAANAIGVVENRENLSSAEGRHFVELMKKVFQVNLVKESENDPVEKKKLEACREKIREYLTNVLNSIRDYISTILALDEAAKTRNKTAIERADDKRTQTHDRLMRDINILNRSIVWWFGRFDPANLSDKQMEMYEKQEEKYISDMIERIEISQNGICPPTINIKNRKEITLWAKTIYKDIVSIRNL